MSSYWKEGAAVGALSGMTGGPVGLVGGGIIGSLFNKNDKKDPWEFERANPNLTMEALAAGYNPRVYGKIKPILDYASEYEQGVESANAANEYRYQQGLGIWDRIYDAYAGFDPAPQADDSYEYGRAQKTAIDKQYHNNYAAAMGNLMNSGLATTTAGSAVASQLGDQAVQQRIGLQDQIHNYRQSRRDYLYNQKLGLQRERIGNLTGAQQGELGWIANKVDAAPDAAWASNMINLFAKYPNRFKRPSEVYYRGATNVATNSRNYSGGLS